MKIKLLHGGQTGVDRGAHEAAIDNGWPIGGYMPLERRDELGAIPADVAAHLEPWSAPGYAARTEANVRTCAMLLVVVYNCDDPRASPGTAKTLDLAYAHRVPRRIVDAETPAVDIARWILTQRPGVQALLGIMHGRDTLPAMPGGGDYLRLLVAGPRESKWTHGRRETAALLRRVQLELVEIAKPRHTVPA